MTLPECLLEVLPCFWGYDVSGRNWDESMEDTWMQQKKQPRAMEILEEKIC
jgi:hypothetical protein